MRGFWLKMAVKYFVVFVIAGLAFGYVVMALWNWLMPEIFGLTEVSFVQALGILLLSKILFGGFFRGKRGGKHAYWKARMKSKWSEMSPEEREKFKEAFKNRCCGYDENPSTEQSEKSGE